MTRQHLDLRPLAVLTGTSLCDGCDQHELTIYTDGITAYAVSPDESREQLAFSRTGVTIDAACPYSNRDYTCDGIVYWRLDEPSAWTTDEFAIGMLGYGEKIER